MRILGLKTHTLKREQGGFNPTKETKENTNSPGSLYCSSFMQPTSILTFEMMFQILAISQHQSSTQKCRKEKTPEYGSNEDITN